MFTERTEITKIGSAIFTKDNCVELKGEWHFFGAPLVDEDNTPITDKWELRGVKVGRILRKILGYKILAFFGAYKNRRITIAGWTPKELVALSQKNSSEQNQEMLEKYFKIHLGDQNECGNK